jgi:hypothetical protein
MLKFRKNTNDDDELNFESKKIKDDLSEIYGESSGEEKVDMEKLDKNSKGGVKMFFTTFFSCSFLIFLFFIVGWVIFNRQDTPVDVVSETKSIRLSIDYPEAVSSGEKIIYKIEYENRDKVEMTKMQLLLSYPEGFIYESSSVESDNSYNNIFTLKDLKPFNKEEIEIVGRLVGDEGADKPLLVSLSYEPANFSSEFQELATATTQITSAAVLVNVSGIPQIIPDQDLEYGLEITNNSKEDINNLRLIAVYPENFKVKEFETDPIKNAEVIGLDFGVSYDVWEITTLEKGAEEKFNLTGMFSGEISDDQIILARIEIGDGEGNYNLIAENFITVKAVGKEVGLDLILNGGNDLKSVSLGDDLSYSIIYENKGESDLKDVKVRAHLKGYQGEKEVSLIDWDSLNDENGGDVKNNEIVWSSDEILKLSSFSSKEEGVIDFFVDLLEAGDVLSNLDTTAGDLQLKSWIEMSVGKIGDAEVDLVVKSNEITVDINTDLVIDSQARYFNNDNIAVGSGPLPPKVGEDTKYRIFWTVENSLREVKDIEIKATLPGNITWSDKTNKDVGGIKFDKATRELSWIISSLPVSIKKGSFDFEVGIKPTEEDKNKILILLGETSLSGVDSKTGVEIKSTHKPLTTDLEDDPITSGRGLVE